MLLALDIPPGLYRNGTNYQSQGRYYDADLWRFFEGVERPVGGWRRKSADAVTGAGRAIWTWVDDTNQVWIAVGTNEGLFVYTRSGALHDITPAGFVPGRRDATTGGGYGRGRYGRGRYGTPRPDTTNVLPAMVWTLDNIGQYLVACDGSTIYLWQLDVDVPAEPLTNAPSASAVMVTAERIIVAIGAGGNPRKDEWSDAEDYTVWTPAGNNLAGGKNIQTQGRLICGRRIKGASLRWTDTDVHLVNYSGLPNVYDYEDLATGCGIVSRQAVAVVDSRAYWMGASRFYGYNGTVEPLDCDLQDDVFTDINRGQASKVTALHLSQFTEVWWLYPSAGSIEIDRYVSFNYRELHWNRGSLVRLSGIDKGVLPYPLMVDNDGYLYEHEVGQVRDGRSPFVLSGPVELGDGTRTMEVETIIPDASNIGDVTVSFEVGDWPVDETFVEGPFATTAQTDVRFSGRRVAVRQIALADRDFRVGRYRFAVMAGSPR